MCNRCPEDAQAVGKRTFKLQAPDNRSGPPVEELSMKSQEVFEISEDGPVYDRSHNCAQGTSVSASRMPPAPGETLLDLNNC